MKHKFFLLLAAALIVGAPVGLYLYVKANEPEQVTRATPATPVILSPVERIDFDDRVEALGTAMANESVTINPKVTEVVTAIHFDDGDLLERGQLLVELRDEEQRALLEEEYAVIEEEKASVEQAKANLLELEPALSNARAQLVEAENQLRRIRSLFDQGSVPESQLDQQVAAVEAARSQVETVKARMQSGQASIRSAEARLRSAESRIRSLQSRLDDRKITAPFSGLAGFREISTGALVTPTTTITTLDDLSVIRVDFPVPERFLADLRPGQEIEAVSAALEEKTFSGIVRSIGSRVDPVTRSVTVRADIPNPELELRPGMLLLVDLIRDRRDTLVVPEEALVPLQGRQYVYMVEDGVAKRVEVVTGTRRPGIIEILSGLGDGDHVVTEGTVRLRPGTHVEVLETREVAAR